MGKNIASAIALIVMGFFLGRGIAENQKLNSDLAKLKSECVASTNK